MKALIVAAAKSLTCRYLLTEDLQANQELDGIVVINPFLRDPASVLLLPARGGRAWLATCIDTVGLLPILSLDRQCCRYSECAQWPSAETSVSIASASLCRPCSAKCAHPSCLISRVQSILVSEKSDEANSLKTSGEPGRTRTSNP